MDKASDIANLVKDAVSGLGLELWGVDYVPRTGNSLVRLYIDRSDREVGIEDCEAVSREVAALFDIDDPIRGQYTLEVSSPGLDRPFFQATQLQRFTGQTVEATLHAPLDGRRRFQGTVLSVAGERVCLEADGVRFEFDFGQAAKIRLKPDYARLMANAGSSRPDAGVPGDKQ